MSQVAIAIAASLERAMQKTKTPRRSEKIDMPEKLDDGITGPTFAFWKSQVLEKLELNADHYPTEAHRRYVIFQSTTGKAQRYLATGREERLWDNYGVDELIQALAKHIVDPVQADADKREYKDMKHEEYPTWQAFISDFTVKAMKAGISQEQWFEDAWDKTSPRLQQLLIPTKWQFNGDFNLYCQAAAATDFDSTILRKNKARAGFNRAPDRDASSPRAQANSVESSMFRPSRTLGGIPRIPTPPVRDKSVAFDTKTQHIPQTRQNSPRRSQTPERTLTCYKCGRPGHKRGDPECPAPGSVNAIEKDRSSDDSDWSGEDHVMIQEVDDALSPRPGNGSA